MFGLKVFYRCEKKQILENGLPLFIVCNMKLSVAEAWHDKIAKRHLDTVILNQAYPE